MIRKCQRYIFKIMSSLNRRSSSKSTRSMVNLGNSVVNKEVVMPAAASLVGGNRDRSNSRERRGERESRSRTCRQYPETDKKEMCNKEYYNDLKKQMETLFQIVSEVKNELVGRNIEKKTDNKEQSPTLGATALDLDQLTGNINDSAIAQNTDKINRLEDKKNETNNIVLGMNIVLEDIRKMLNDQSNKSYSEWIQNGTLRVFLSTNKLFKAKVLNRLMRKLASVKLLHRLSSCGNISRLV